MQSTFRRSTLAALRGFALPSDAISIVPSAADYRRCLLEKIASATRRIYIIALYLQQDEAGQEVLDAGVPVQTRELFGVLHLKGSVIDDCVLYTGASLNNVYLHKLDKYRLDRYHLIESTALADSFVNLVQREILPSPAVHRLDLQSPPSSRSLRSEIRAFSWRSEARSL